MRSSVIWLTFLQIASPRAELQQAREMLRADFAAVTLGVAIAGIGLAALALAQVCKVARSWSESKMGAALRLICGMIR